MELLKKRKHFMKTVPTSLVVVFCVLTLVIFGVFVVYSASSYNAEINYNNSFYYARKQIIGAIIGLFCMVFFYFLNTEKLKKFYWIALVVSIILLIVVFIPGIGTESYGSNRWINLGFFTIQASEVAKFGFILFAATMLSKQKDKAKTFRGMLPTLLAGCSICLLIILEPNMSITMCVGATMLIMLFVGGSSIKHFALILIPAIILVPILILIEPYRLARLSAFLDPWSSPLEEGFQLIQSYYALGSGGWFGLGYGNSRQKNLFLPFSESDFIFSIIGEEFGFIGCSLVIILFIVLIFSGFKIALKSDTRFKCYLATGITSIIAMQFIVNVAVVSGAMPPTGLPLPFISSGSSALIMFLCGIGVLLSCTKQTNKRWFSY